MTSSSSSRGFTLIEIMVVVAVIGILSTVVSSQVALARVKGADSAKKAQLTSVRTALQTFNIDKGRMPHNYECGSGSCVVDDGRSTLAIEDTAHPNDPVTESGKAYRASMQELVNGKYLPGTPHSPGGAGYTYYNYGPGSAAGAIIGTTMDADAPTTTGRPGTCRPFSGSVGFNEAPAWLRTLVATQAFAAAVFDLGDDPGGGVLGGGENCIYVGEDGLSYEAPCPETTTNFCSTSSSADYCLCSPY
jgi:prepilin-type N-terminal cleavage/methylation domain-containing protein